MSSTVSRLSTASTAIRTAVKDSYKKVQEIQLMRHHDTYFASANYEGATSEITKDMVNAAFAEANLPTMTSFLSVGTASSASKKTTSQQMVVIKAVSNSDTIVHAEQLLLLTVAHKLHAGTDPMNFSIGGHKIPCSKCLKVLKAFRSAYNDVYGRTVSYHEKAEGQSTKNTSGNARIVALDLSGEFSGVESGSTFGKFLTAYSAAL